MNSNACVCDEGWSGPLCQYNDSQNGVPKIEPSQSQSKLTAAVHSVLKLKQSGTLLLVMKVWVSQLWC